MSVFQPGDRVTVGGRPGEVVGVAAYGDLYPENVRADQARTTPPKLTPPDPKSPVVAVRFADDPRPRNYPATQVQKGGE